MQVGARTPPFGGEALRQHLDDLVELLAGEVAVRVGAPGHVPEGLLRHLAGGSRGDDLLGKDVEGLGRHDDPVELPGPGRHDRRSALDQLVAGQGEQDSLRDATEPVTGPSDALHQGRQCPGGAQVADEVDVAHVDAQLQGRRGDNHPERP